MGPLVVNVADLLHRRGARRHERLTAPSLPGLAVVGTVVPADEPVDVDVDLESVSDGILATGSVTARWRSECRRCLTDLAGEVRGDFQELFEPHARDGETYPLHHEHVDLEPLARETLLLELPLAPLCREECRGLCPTCGADLNQGACRCAPADRDPRWGALDELRDQLNR
jgi:DUF177 domain-containing protein